MFHYFFPTKDITTTALTNVNSKFLEIFKTVEKVKTFKRKFEESGGIISGSFLVQSILNAWWQDSDIDIFLPYEYLTTDKMDATSSLSKWLESEFGKATSLKYTTDHSNYTTDPSNCGYTGNCEVNTNTNTNTNNINLNIKRIYEHKLVDFKLQIIYVDVERQKLGKYIHDMFDFRFLKNLYYVENDIEQLDIKSIDEVTNKIIHSEIVYHNTIKLAQRVQKYVQRGFKSDTYTTDQLIHLNGITVPIDEFDIANVSINKYTRDERSYELLYNSQKFHISMDCNMKCKSTADQRDTTRQKLSIGFTIDKDICEKLKSLDDFILSSFEVEKKQRFMPRIEDQNQSVIYINYNKCFEFCQRGTLYKLQFIPKIWKSSTYFGATFTGLSLTDLS